MKESTPEIEQGAFPKLVDMRTADFDHTKASHEVLAIMCEEWKRRARVHFKLAERMEGQERKEANLIADAFLECATDLECHLRLGQVPPYLSEWQSERVNPTTGLHPLSGSAPLPASKRCSIYTVRSSDAQEA